MESKYSRRQVPFIYYHKISTEHLQQMNTEKNANHIAQVPTPTWRPYQLQQSGCSGVLLPFSWWKGSPGIRFKLLLGHHFCHVSVLDHSVVWLMMHLVSCQFRFEDLKRVKKSPSLHCNIYHIENKLYFGVVLIGLRRKGIPRTIWIYSDRFQQSSTSS